jgi:tRNA pseudouridine13 synthase
MHKIKYEIKQKPEDFIVKEISNKGIAKNGLFTYFILKKRNYTTLRAIQHIADALKVPPKSFSFAGTKDKMAVTEQLVSVKNAGKERLEKVKLKDINIKYVGKGEGPISLGELEGNEFEIIIRAVEKIPKLKTRFKNFFGPQRFSTNNQHVGKAIVKKDFKKAVELVLENKGENEKMLGKYLKDNPNDHIGALRKLPKKLLKMYVHAYQSFLWNRLAEKFDDIDVIPIVGFDEDIEDEKMEKEYEILMKEEGITFRDFIIKQLPGISPEGDRRNLFAEARELEMEIIDEKTIKLKFKLKRGCYATVFIDQLFQEQQQ